LHEYTIATYDSKLCNLGRCLCYVEDMGTSIIRAAKCGQNELKARAGVIIRAYA